MFFRVTFHVFKMSKKLYNKINLIENDTDDRGCFVRGNIFN